jgi:uncharacterized protein YjiS (DUF1127 family)
MTDIAMHAFNRGWNLGFATGRVDAFHHDLRERLARRREARRIEAELRQYGADEIAELGISRADIHFVADKGWRR